MNSLKNILKNPLLGETHARQLVEIKARFPELKECPHTNFLSLRRYISQSPHRFYSESVYSVFLGWLSDQDKTRRLSLKQYLSAHDAELNRAFLHLEEINRLKWHDHFEKSDDYEQIRFIDQQIHPTYLRLTESVLAPFVCMMAYFSRINRGAGTDGLDIWQSIQEIETTYLSQIAEPYKHRVRNGIAHGGITYFQREILYRDKKGNEEKHADIDIIRMFDNLLDNCNALVLAISVFLITNQRSGYQVPRQLLLDELREETRTPWWEIVGCTPFEIDGNKQLTIYARPRTRESTRALMSAFQSGVLAELYAPGYNRYSLSLQSSFSFLGWADFDGKELHRLREEGAVRLEDYRGAVDFVYMPRFKTPRIIS